MRFAILTFCVAAAAPAQDVGMGARKGSGARFEAPYTTEVVTPHEKWANPLPGGPIRLLAVPTVTEGRTLVEIAQRLSLDLTAVTIDPAWDRNKWTMAFGRNYGARADRGDMSLIYSYLEAELTGEKNFDAILLPVNHGWEAFSPAAREALTRRIRDGAGLVLMRPVGSLSPVLPRAMAESRGDSVEPAHMPAGAWKPAMEHYITRGIPFESFPFAHLTEYQCNLIPSAFAKLAIQSSTGNSILAVQPYGKGRIAVFGFRNNGMSWAMPLSARAEVTQAQWEYYYALLVRTIIWAANREPAKPADFTAGVWRLKSFDGSVKQSGQGKPPAFPKLAPGTYFLEQQTAEDFRIQAIPIAQPDKVENVQVTPEVVAEGGVVKASWKAARQATVELIDGFGRVIAKTRGNGAAQLKSGRPLTHSGYLRVTAGTAAAQTAVRFANSRKWEDYEVIMPWYGPGGNQPWIPALDEQFRKVGITALSSPERNFRLIASAGLHDTFGVYYYRSQEYARRKKAWFETKDKKYLTRDVVLQAPGFAAELRAQLQKRIGPLAPLKPLAYYIADESSLTSYTDAFDVDWSPEAIAGYREWAKRVWGSLEQLNAGWGTNFAKWEDVLPMTAEEARKNGNYVPWSTHRVYMEQEFLRALRMARDIVTGIDPGSVSSISGTQVPTAHNGANWYEIDQFMDYLQPYSGGNQDAMHHLFRPGILLTGFTGYGLTGPEAQYQQWQRLFYGHTGASIFWHYTILNPDLTLSEQGKALAEAFGRIQSGIGRMFMNSKVREDGIAIHFSMASIRGMWISDGEILPTVGNVNRTSKNYAAMVARRDAWVKALERKGVQFRFLASPQIEAGALKDYKTLILPDSIALSSLEAQQIRKFADSGGTVYLDGKVGLMDEWCRPYGKAVLDEGSKGFLRKPPEQFEWKHPFGLDGDFLATVRDFGAARLIGILPREKASITLPAPKGVRYNLLNGGVAAGSLALGMEKPAILLERSSVIKKLAITPKLELLLTDETGAPVDRSVVRVEVFDGAGKLVRHYSCNVTITDGRGRLDIPFALNDAGKWTVKARDVVSGLTAERTLSR